MSDGVTSVELDAPAQASPSQLLSAGAMLRRSREAAGLHVAALAVAMKVPVKKLEALEADRLDLLPDVVFVRALASSVCRTLKIDAGPILDKLPRTSTPSLLTSDRAINTPFRTPGESAAMSIPGMFKKPSVLLVLALLVAACVVYFIPELQRHESITDAVPAPLMPGPDANPTPAPQAPDGAVALAAPVGVPEAPLATPTLPLPTPAPITEVVAANPVATTVAIDSMAGQAPVKNTAAPAPVPATDKVADVPASTSAAAGVGVLSLKAKASSWVQVVDAKGVVQLSRTLNAGETVGVSGIAPLSVVIGRVDAMDVEVRGKPFSLTGIAKENVARFEVK